MPEESVACRAEALGSMAVLLDFAAGLFRSSIDEERRAFVAAIDLAEDDPVFVQEACRAGLAQMKAFCAEPAAGPKALLRRASDAFHDLFVGPHHVLCPPWGSVYLDGGRLFGPSALAVGRLMRAHGLDIPEGRSEPSDHIAYELAFLAVCTRRAAGEDAEAGGTWSDAAAAARDGRSFLVTYVEPWYASFAADVRREDPTGFYAGLADFTAGLLALDDKLLGQVI